LNAKPMLDLRAAPVLYSGRRPWSTNRRS